MLRMTAKELVQYGFCQTFYSCCISLEIVNLWSPYPFQKRKVYVLQMQLSALPHGGFGFIED